LSSFLSRRAPGGACGAEPGTRRFPQENDSTRTPAISAPLASGGKSASSVEPAASTEIQSRAELLTTSAALTFAAGD